MKRFKIKNLTNNTDFVVEREELGDHQPEWGRHERWVREGEEDITSATETRIVAGADGAVTEYLLPAEYTIIEEDITEDVKNQKREAYKVRREAQAEQAILQVLNDRQAPTQIARALHQFAVALNFFGDATAEEQFQARQAVGEYLSMLQAAEAIMAQRDTDIANYNPDAE